MSRRMRTSRLWLILSAVGLLLLSCEPAEQRSADGRIIINYWEKWTGFEADAMQAVVDDFNASQNRLFVKLLPVSQIDHKLMLATAGGNPPDVAGLWSHTVNVYAEKGALTPLDGMLEKAGITRDHYTPIFWDLCQHRGFAWALPSTPATIALHWNKRLFRETGLDPDHPPTTLAELDAMAEQLTIVELKRDGEKVRLRWPELTQEEKNAKQFRLIQLGFTPTEPGWWSQMWGYWFDAALWDEQGRITANTSENIAAYQWYTGYGEKYGVNNVLSFSASFAANTASAQNAFLSGRVAMVIQGVWMHNFIEKFSPHLEWGAAPFPAMNPKHSGDVTIAECDVLVIPKGSPHPREAFEFIRYVNTPAAMEKLTLAQRKFSPLAEVSESFVANHPNPYIEVFIDLAHSPEVKIVPRVSVWNVYFDEMTVAADRMFTKAATPEAALAHVEQRVQWKLDRVVRRWEKIKDERQNEWAQQAALWR